MIQARVIALLAACLLIPALSALDPPEAVEAPARPERIVALTLASAEMLIDLVPPERIAAVHEMVARSPYSNVRDAVRGIPRVGSEAEDLIAAQPDLVLSASYVRPELREPLARAGLPVHAFADVRDLEDVFRNFLALGERVGEPERARARVAALRAEVEAIRASVPQVRAAPRVVWLGASGTVAGAATTFDSLCKLAGARNLAAEHGVVGFRAIGPEALASWRPDVIVVGVDPESGASLKTRLRRDAAYASLESARILEIRFGHVTCVSQYLVEGLRDLVRGLYP